MEGTMKNEANPTPHPRFTVVGHPLLENHLTGLRDERAPAPEFRRHLEAAARVLAVELARDLETAPMLIRTPLEEMEGRCFRNPHILVPILRAGLGFLNGFLEIMPWARVGHLGMARNETTLEPESYYARLPDGLEQSEVLLLDPMLATGGSASSAIAVLKKAGASRIRFCCLVAAPEGVALLAQAHPDVPVLAGALDRQLNDKGFILPGLGDAGDRYFGT